jgi:hypothetical protein
MQMITTVVIWDLWRMCLTYLTVVVICSAGNYVLYEYILTVTNLELILVLKHVNESALFLAELILTFIGKISVKQALRLRSYRCRL